MPPDGQVRFNQESTERQYNLMNKARALGWRQDQIRVLDGDLGQSGSSAANRADFKILVGDVAMGHVGAIFSLEASRLARSNVTGMSTARRRSQKRCGRRPVAD